jgi:hypothetical protein
MMVISTYFFISWIVITIFALIPKPLKYTENIIILFIISIILTDYLTIVGYNYSFLNLTKKREHFLAFLLFRNIIIPLLLLVLVNIFYAVTSLKKRILFVFFLLFIMTVIERINTFFKLYSYSKWNVYLSIGVYLLLIVLCLLLTKGLMLLQNINKDRGR